MQAKNRKQNILNLIDHLVTNSVLNAAREGKTQCLWTTPLAKHYLGGVQHPASIPFTNEELIEALKEKFPDTTVEYQETWVDVRPGVKEHQKGILIEWS